MPISGFPPRKSWSRLIRFLSDENVREDILEFLEERGHEVVRSRNVLAAGTPDQLLALLGRFESLVVVTHDRDFRNFRKLLPEGERTQFSRGSGRLQLEIAYEKALMRVSEEIENIEHHYHQAQKNERLFLMTIQDANIKITTK